MNPDPRLDAIEDIRCDEMARDERREEREDAHRAAQSRTTVRLPEPTPPESATGRAALAVTSHSPPLPSAAVAEPAAPRRHFECESHPQFGNAERGCLPSDGDGKHEAWCKSGGGCFSQDIAYCFFVSRSRAVLLVRGAPLPPPGQNWSTTEVGQDCLATPAECDSFRMGVGTGSGGQPPVKAPCMPIPGREASNDP
jgi:hypothetical protein